VRPSSLFVYEASMGMEKISEFVVYETGEIKKASVQTPVQLVDRYVYMCNPQRNKISVEEERHPINLKERRGSI
jgi:hypothetical protein